MIKQIDRVLTALRGQAAMFRDQNEHSISVAIVGVNFSPVYVGYEGDSEYPADPPPQDEAPRAIERLNAASPPRRTSSGP